MRTNYVAPHLAWLGLSALLLNGCSSLATDSQPKGVSSQPTAPVIALVLGGGGAKGYAHVGVIKALEANHITPDLVVGTSVGSFVGSIYASGKSAAELESIAVTTADSELTDFTLSYQGIIAGQKLRSFVNTQVNNKPIQAFPIRFAAVAAEKHSLKKAVFTEGEAGTAGTDICVIVTGRLWMGIASAFALMPALAAISAARAIVMIFRLIAFTF